MFCSLVPNFSPTRLGTFVPPMLDSQRHILGGPKLGKNHLKLHLSQMSHYCSWYLEFSGQFYSSFCMLQAASCTSSEISESGPWDITTVGCHASHKFFLEVAAEDMRCKWALARTSESMVWSTRWLSWVSCSGERGWSDKPSWFRFWERIPNSEENQFQ